MGGLGGGLEEGAITKDEQETTPRLSPTQHDGLSPHGETDRVGWGSVCKDVT